LKEHTALSSGAHRLRESDGVSVQLTRGGYHFTQTPTVMLDHWVASGEPIINDSSDADSVSCEVRRDGGPLPPFSVENPHFFARAFDARDHFSHMLFLAFYDAFLRVYTISLFH